MRNKITKIKILFCILVSLSSCISKNTEITTPPTKGIFEEDSVMNLTLKINLNKLLTDIGEDRKWHKGSLIWNEKSMQIEVKTRGNFRRNPENCNFPPLFLAFDSLSRIGTPFEKYDKIRLVSHCQKDSATYEQIGLEEYNIYKTYSLFTDKSVITRLCKITYQDTENKQPTSTKIAFFVEGTDYSAKRLGVKLVEQTDTIQYLESNSFLTTQLAVFQFMVGNADWSISNKHNLSILEMPNQDYVAIPFDFDFAGIIDAPYAGTDPNLGTESVTERVYRGYCQSDAELVLVLEKFKEKEKEVKQVWQNLPFQQPERKAKSLKYIDGFYTIIQNKDSIDYYFLKNCR